MELFQGRSSARATGEFTRLVHQDIEKGANLQSLRAYLSLHQAFHTGDGCAS